MGRGGALVTSFDYELVSPEPIETVGEVSAERLWDNYEYFIRSVIPAAEKANVKLALHPDDPPVSPLRGISRIFTDFASIRRAMELVASPCHGVTFCQGCFAAMDEDLPRAIAYFGQQKKLFYVHFRDVVGCARNFRETFHDEGKTDMARVLLAYKQAGFDGYIRVDHVPTMEGEANQKPGYETMGRLFAIGYLKGLLEGINYNF
jgi:mannonate dehydratase